MKIHMAQQARRYDASHALATVIGLSLMVLDAYGAWEANLKEAGQITYIVIAAPVIASVSWFSLRVSVSPW